jgi:hypothetical protein
MNGVSFKKWWEFDSRYERPLTSAVFASWFLWCFWALHLDGGVRKTGCNIALVGFWAGVVLILLRRPHRPTRVDLLYIRFAVIPLILVTVPAYLKYWGWFRRLAQQLAAQ